MKSDIDELRQQLSEKYKQTDKISPKKECRSYKHRWTTEMQMKSYECDQDTLYLARLQLNLRDPFVLM